jgi:hypothetical protein
MNTPRFRFSLAEFLGGAGWLGVLFAIAARMSIELVPALLLWFGITISLAVRPEKHERRYWVLIVLITAGVLFVIRLLIRDPDS